MYNDTQKSKAKNNGNHLIFWKKLDFQIFELAKTHTYTIKTFESLDLNQNRDLTVQLLLCYTESLL